MVVLWPSRKMCTDFALSLMAEDSTSPSLTTNSFSMYQICISSFIFPYPILSYLSGLAGYPTGSPLSVWRDLDGMFFELLAIGIDRHLEPGKLHCTEDVDLGEKER